MYVGLGRESVYMLRVNKGAALPVQKEKFVGRRKMLATASLVIW